LLLEAHKEFGVGDYLKMNDSKNQFKPTLLKYTAIGIGIGIGLGIVAATLLWYETRPPKSTPWNAKAITAHLDKVDFPGSRNIPSPGFIPVSPPRVDFVYVLENNTDKDLAAFSHEEQVEYAIRVFCVGQFSLLNGFWGYSCSYRPLLVRGKRFRVDFDCLWECETRFVFLLFQQRSAVQTAAKIFCQG
jgi:hypothetical protein